MRVTVSREATRSLLFPRLPLYGCGVVVVVLFVVVVGDALHRKKEGGATPYTALVEDDGSRVASTNTLSVRRSGGETPSWRGRIHVLSND